MLNYIWAGMIIISFCFSIVNNTQNETVLAMFDSLKDSMQNIIVITGFICFWNGIMKIAQESKIIDKIGTVLRPLLKKLFPEIPENNPAMEAIIMNMSANILGMGNAATPFGLKAMGHLQDLNKDKKTATNAMRRLVVLNTASIQLIPTTVIAMRATYNSQNPNEIVLPVIIVSVIAAICAIFLTKGRKK